MAKPFIFHNSSRSLKNWKKSKQHIEIFKKKIKTVGREFKNTWLRNLRHSADFQNTQPKNSIHSAESFKTLGREFQCAQFQTIRPKALNATNLKNFVWAFSNTLPVSNIESFKKLAWWYQNIDINFKILDRVCLNFKYILEIQPGVWNLSAKYFKTLAQVSWNFQYIFETLDQVFWRWLFQLSSVVSDHW